MKKENPTKVFSRSFCEMFINFSSQQLPLSMKGTKNCLYCRESSKYGTTVKMIVTMIVKINASTASIISLQSALGRQLSVLSYICQR